jgi:anti-anti-sigma regulatory factor
MNQNSRGIFVASTPEAVFIRIIGRGACRNSEPLREYGLAKLREGYSRIYVDLLSCDGMDSTFLGVFAGFGLALRNPGALTLVNLRGENLKCFNSLGLDHIACVENAQQEALLGEFPQPSSFQLLPGSDLDAKDPLFDALERALLMLECHEDLCRVDTRNEDRFRDVKQFLRDDIARHTEPNAKPARGRNHTNNP